MRAGWRRQEIEGLHYLDRRIGPGMPVYLTNVAFIDTNLLLRWPYRSLRYVAFRLRDRMILFSSMEFTVTLKWIEENLEAEGQ